MQIISSGGVIRPRCIEKENEGNDCGASGADGLCRVRGAVRRLSQPLLCPLLQQISILMYLNIVLYQSSERRRTWHQSAQMCRKCKRHRRVISAERLFASKVFEKSRTKRRFDHFQNWNGNSVSNRPTAVRTTLLCCSFLSNLRCLSYQWGVKET